MEYRGTTNQTNDLVNQSQLANMASKDWVEGKCYLTEHQSLAAYRTSAEQDVIDAALTKAQSINYTTTAPTAANPDGIKVVVLTAEPETKYDGWLYLIKG